MNTTRAEGRTLGVIALCISCLALAIALLCLARSSVLVQARISASRFVLANTRDQSLGWIESPDSSGTVLLVLFIDGKEQRFRLRADEEGQLRWVRD